MINKPANGPEDLNQSQEKKNILEENFLRNYAEADIETLEKTTFSEILQLGEQNLGEMKKEVEHFHNTKEYNNDYYNYNHLKKLEQKFKNSGFDVDDRMIAGGIEGLFTNVTKYNYLYYSIKNDVKKHYDILSGKVPINKDNNKLFVSWYNISFYNKVYMSHIKNLSEYLQYLKDFIDKDFSKRLTTKNLENDTTIKILKEYRKMNVRFIFHLKALLEEIEKDKDKKSERKEEDIDIVLETINHFIENIKKIDALMDPIYREQERKELEKKRRIEEVIKYTEETGINVEDIKKLQEELSSIKEKLLKDKLNPEQSDPQELVEQLTKNNKETLELLNLIKNSKKITFGRSYVITEEDYKKITKFLEKNKED